VTAIVDTGCTISTIRADMAAALGLPLQGRATVATANGTRQCDVVLAELFLKSRGKTVRSLRQLAIAPTLNEMLFGMDAMEGGVLTVDCVGRVWERDLKHVGPG
jgi:predicted aspartyl protease